MIDFIVRCGTVITVDPARRVITDGAVAINDGELVGVGTAEEVAAAFDARTVIYRPFGVMLPGLVDAHSHAGHALVRTMADDLDLWMDTCERLYLHGATPEFWYAESRLSAAERLLAGTTTSLSMLGGAGDTVRSDRPEHGRAHLDAYGDVGLRTVVVVGPGAPPFPKLTTEHTLPHEPRELASTFDDQIATVVALDESATGEPLASVATTFPTLLPADVVAPNVRAAARRLLEVADERTMHIVQDGHRGATVVASADLGLLGDRTLLSHATDLDEAEIALIAESGASVAHNPSAIFSQYGRCPAPELIAAGVTVGLGSDATAPDRSADMFRHMFQLTRYHRAARQNPAWFPPGMAIEMATIESAKALGMADAIGSLEPGKRADLIIVDTDRPHLAPVTHPVHQIVYFATGADVDVVMVGGTVLVERGQPVELDVGSIIEAARQEQTKAFARIALEQPPARPGLWGSTSYQPTGA